MAFFIDANIHVIYLTSKYLTCVLYVFCMFLLTTGEKFHFVPMGLFLDV